MTQLDYDLENYQNSLNERSECQECLTLIDRGDSYCSNACFRASLQ